MRRVYSLKCMTQIQPQESIPEEIVQRPMIAKIDSEALEHNLSAVRSKVGSAVVMGIVKANAYGHGLVGVANRLLEMGVKQLGVALLEEGVVLRKAGIDAPVLVLGDIVPEQIPSFIKYDLMITASSVYKIEKINEAAKALGYRAKVHLTIDTGMERIGIHSYNANLLFEAAVKAEHCDILGVYSHFASSDSPDKGFTELQLERFLEAVEYFPRHSLPMPVRHIANSGAIIQHPDAILDMVRPGIMLYGVYPSECLRPQIDLRPVMSLEARVVYFKLTKKGAPVGYDGTWTAPRDTHIATLPVGYADGFRRSLSNKGFVLINGKKYPVVGRVSMDQMVVDIGRDTVRNGDKAVLVGRQGKERIAFEELAGLIEASPYEMLTGISERVPRVM